MLPVFVHLPTDASYTSAVDRTGDCVVGSGRPPATRTFPLPSSTAMWSNRAPAMEPVFFQNPRVDATKKLRSANARLPAASAARAVSWYWDAQGAGEKKLA